MTTTPPESERRALESSGEMVAVSSNASLPPPSLLIIIVEFWERFSYYGVLAILVLFLSASPSQGGFGWTLSASLLLISAFAGFATGSPVLGGIIADRFLGTRRSVAYGAVLLTLGNCSLVLAVLTPELLSWLEGVSVVQSMHSARVPLGLLKLSDEQWHVLAQGAQSTRAKSLTVVAYRSQALLFFGGLSLIVLGNAFLKSALPVLLGQVFAAHGGRSDVAYNYYYMAVTLGVLASSLTVGYMAEVFGWASGFACAATGMTIALLLFIGLGPRVFGSIGLVPVRLAKRARQRHREPLAGYTFGLIRMAIYGVFLLIFAVGWTQPQALWLYVIQNDVQRKVWGFTIPAPWLVGLYSVCVCIYSPIYAALSRRISRARGGEPSFGTRFVAGFIVLVIAHSIMCIGFAQPPGALSPIGWSIGALAVLGVADVVVWPPSYGMVQRLSPPTFRNALLGGWIAMLGVGQSVAHAVAIAAGKWGFSRFSAAIAALMGLSALVLGGINRLLAAVEQRRGLIGASDTDAAEGEEERNAG